jgi:alkane 1-monooxygenase
MSNRYLTPFAFLALLLAGGLMGGAWTFLAAVATPLGLVTLDAVFGGGDPSGTSAPRGRAEWLPRIFIVLQLVATCWATLRATAPSPSLMEATGLALSAGVVSGVFGFVAAHQLIHSRAAGDRALGLTFLASVFYMHFRIAHLHGHHRRAATFEDPASARLGEGLYRFLWRSITGQFREAWAFEARRRRNRLVSYLVVEAALLLLLALVSWRALMFVAGMALVSVTLLEAFNYVAHYGLTRRDGERLGPQHSWNSSRRMNNAALFNMGRHSDHHRRPAGRFDALEPVARSAELPAGYAAALLTALVPPLWRRTMDPRARALMERL